MPDGGSHASDRKRHRQDVLPHSLVPLAVDRVTAAASVNASPTLFDEMVADGRMPRPKKMNGRRVWIVTALARALEALPTAGEDNQPNTADLACGFVSQTGPGT